MKPETQIKARLSKEIKMMEEGHVRKVGRTAVHLMKTEADDNDEYRTLCGQSFLITNSDLTEDVVTCPRCLQLMKLGEKPSV